jgi:hypothetical protein
VAWLEGIVFLIAGALLAWGTSHFYYRRAKTDDDTALASLRADLERLATQGSVSVERNTSGQIVKVRRHHRRRMRRMRRRRREAAKAA